MKHQFERMVRKIGHPIDVYNDVGDGGGRSMPSSEKDGTIWMVREERGQSRVVTDSSGTEHEVTLEFRCTLDEDDEDQPSVEPAAGGGPTVLETPWGERYRVVRKFREDQGVWALSVVED